MESLTSQLLVSLCRHHSEPALSLFAPSSLAWPVVAQNQTRWENIRRQAAKALVARGMAKEQADEFLRPIIRLPGEKDFSENSSETVAYFHSPTLSTTVRLPGDVGEQAIVSSHFFILPLVKALAGNGLFYILALSKNKVRLLEGQRDHLTEVSVPDLPSNLTSSLHYDPRSPNLQTHGGVVHGKARHNTVVHGQGGATDWSKDELKAYFRIIDQAVHPYLSASKAPLLLVCVDYYEPIYREINSYPYLLTEHVSGSPEGFADRYLLELAWKLVSPRFEQAEDLALRHCYELSDTKRFSTDLEKIILSARAGQIETLFLAENVARWGIYDSVADCVKVFDERLPESEDLMNLAAAETISTGGKVLLVPAEDIPQRSEIAAIFRYEPVDIDYVARMDRP